MRTVSPTFALVGVIRSLGPLGAAGKRKERKGGEIEREGRERDRERVGVEERKKEREVEGR